MCSAKKALILLLLNKAENIAKVQGKVIRSVSLQIDYPSVVRLKRFVSVPYTQVILSRRNILRRDGNKCAYCGRSDVALTVDHVIPKARGGKDTWENLVAACLVCNNRKGNRTPEEADMKLLVKPFKPNHIMFIKYHTSRTDDSWKPFLFHV